MCSRRQKFFQMPCEKVRKLPFAYALPAAFSHLLQAADAVFRGRMGAEEAAYLPAEDGADNKEAGCCLIAALHGNLAGFCLQLVQGAGQRQRIAAVGGAAFVGIIFP